MRKFFCSLMVLVLMCTVPVFGADMVPEEAVISEEGFVSSEEISVVEDAVAAAPVERYISQEADTFIMDTLPAEELISEAVGELNVVCSDGAEERVQASGASSSKYYSQAAYQVKAGYDLIAAYIRGEDGKYASRLFFVYDQQYGEWLRYDYSATAAETFLSTSEQKDSNGTTLYVPVAKKSGEKTVLHSDIPGTALDESKVPVLAAADVSGINYAWKALSEIPFAMSGGSYEYAAEESTTPDPPQPVPGKKTGTVTINGANYVVYWTETVKYNGRAHVWSQKTTAKQTADIEVEIFRDGALVDSGNYSIACKSNTNVTGFGGGKVNPYFVITMKGNYKKDAKKMSKYKFTFDITPYSFADGGTVRAKKIMVSGTKTSFTKPVFIFPDGKQISLSPYSDKKPKGTYTATVAGDGSIHVTGYNNFSGETTVAMDAPKKITYEW